MAESILTRLFSLDGRTAVVTGGTRGIGEQMAIALAEAGADIILIQVRLRQSTWLVPRIWWATVKRDEMVLRTKSKIESIGRKAYIYAADLSSEKDVSELAEAILADGHDVDILLNCAGIQRRHPSHLFPKSDWDEVKPNLSIIPGGY
jgi:2-dehydro-3-deoxy-D-gluconate 5-dehydrogenase